MNTTCPGCGTSFEPKRSNQRYCDSACQKKATRNSSRSDRTIENLEAIRLHYDRAIRLAEMLYKVPINERLGVMKDILDSAELPEQANIRRILTDPKLLKAHPRNIDDKGLFLDGRHKTISQAATTYTYKFFGISIQTYLRRLKMATLDELFEVQRGGDTSAIPSLKPMRKAKCWHKVLTVMDDKGHADRVLDEIDTIVATSQANVETYKSEIEAQWLIPMAA